MTEGNLATSGRFNLQMQVISQMEKVSDLWRKNLIMKTKKLALLTSVLTMAVTISACGANNSADYSTSLMPTTQAGPAINPILHASNLAKQPFLVNGQSQIIVT